MNDDRAVLIVSRALLEGEEGWMLHPCLDPWREALARRRRAWFRSGPGTPLSWYALLHGISDIGIVAASFPDLPADMRQYWIASPYHAQLGRDSVRLLADGELPFSARDAEWLCELLNPLLNEEGMRLMAHGAAMMLGCRRPLQAEPVDFGCIAGGMLPDRHPRGTDGGRLMRLLSEIQMQLHRHPAVHRRERGEPDIHGLWLWSPGMPVCRDVSGIPVATRNPALQSLADGRDAHVTISEVERLPELLPVGGRLPRHVLLGGDGMAVLLSRSLWPHRGGWQPKKPASESMLGETLRALL